MKRYNVEWEAHVLGFSHEEARDLIFLARKGLSEHPYPDEIELDVEELSELIPR